MSLLRDTRVLLLLRILKTWGYYNPREVASDAARGEYVAFMDADDRVDFEMYEKMYIKAVNTVADVVVCGFYEMYFKVNSHGDDILTKKTTSGQYSIG